MMAAANGLVGVVDSSDPAGSSMVVCVSVRGPEAGLGCETLAVGSFFSPERVSHV